MHVRNLRAFHTLGEDVGRNGGLYDHFMSGGVVYGGQIPKVEGWVRTMRLGRSSEQLHNSLACKLLIGPVRQVLVDAVELDVSRLTSDHSLLIG